MRRYVYVKNVQVHLGVIVALCAVLLLSSAMALLYYTKTIDHTASILTSGKVQTYLDAGLTQPLNSHDWGNFNTSSGNDVKTLDVYLRNEGNVAVNVTWTASGFASYNQAATQFETPSWILYLVKVDGTETRLGPENATSPDKVNLTALQVVHLKFYLTAKSASPAETLNFKTYFNSKDT